MSDVRHEGRFREPASWTRTGGIGGRHLDLLDARIARRHHAPYIPLQFAVGGCAVHDVDGPGAARSYA